MTIDEIRELLPFYVAGTLDSAEKIEIDEALRTSEELRKELKFWQGAQSAMVAQSEYAKAGHLSAILIVDFAEGIAPEDSRSAIELHLQSCEACAEEYRLVRATLMSRDPLIRPFNARSSDVITRFRLAYALPLAAAMIVVAVLYFGDFGSIDEKPTISDGRPSIKVDETISLFLTYTPELRSTAQRQMPVLFLNNQTTAVEIFAAVPHNALEDIRYSVEIALGQQITRLLEDSLQRYASGSEFDSLHLILDQSQIPASEDTLGLRIKEVLPGNLSGLTAEEYRFSIIIERR